MTRDPIEVRRAGIPALDLASRAFLRFPALHVVLLVWLQLRQLAQGTTLRTNDDFAASLGIGETQFKHAVRILRRVGLVVEQGATRARVLYVADQVDAWSARVLEGIAGGVVVVDFRAGTVTHESGKLLDAAERLANSAAPAAESAQFSRSSGRIDPIQPLQRPNPGPFSRSSGRIDEVDSHVNAASHAAATDSAEHLKLDHRALPENQDIYSTTSSDSNYVGLSATATPSTTPYNPPPTDPPLDSKPKVPRPSRKLNPATDPHRADVEAIVAHANGIFGTNHGALVPARFKVIKRALTEYGFTRDQLTAALDRAKVDPWWAERRIVDTEALLRQLSVVQRWVDESAGTRQAPVRQFDRKAVSLALELAGEGETRVIESESF